MRKTLLVCLLAAAACGGKKGGPHRVKDGNGAVDPYGWDEAAGPGAIKTTAGGPAGRIEGVVRYEGTPPAGTVGRNAAGCGGSAADPILRVADGKLAGAVVWVSGAKGAVAPGLVELTQKSCLYEPPVAAGAVGSKVRIGNDDPLLHNVHGYQDSDGVFNRPSNAGQEVSYTLDAPGILVLKCDVHPWMLAHVLAFDHPYFAVTDSAGTFSMPAPPPGDYELRVWQAKLGEKRAPLHVDAAGVAVDAAYP